MNHSFDIAHAQEYGIPAAILLNNIQFWIAKNRANGKHFHEGRTWTYNSVAAFHELFPYMGTKQIRYALDRLVEAGVLLKRNINEKSIDRTLWYAFADEQRFLEPVVAFAKTDESHSPKGEKGFAEKDAPLTQKGESTIYTDINTDINTDTKNSSADSTGEKNTEEQTPSSPDGDTESFSEETSSATHHGSGEESHSSDNDETVEDYSDKAMVFDMGVPALKNLGMPGKAARGMVGKALKQVGVAGALRICGRLVAFEKHPNPAALMMTLIQEESDVVFCFLRDKYGECRKLPNGTYKAGIHFFDADGRKKVAL